MSQLNPRTHSFQAVGDAVVQVNAERRPGFGFIEFYPNGLPVLHSELPNFEQSTPGFGPNEESWIDKMLPPGFYTQLPPDDKRPAIFSTHRGQQPFRYSQRSMPEKCTRLWSEDEVQSVCISLRQVHWAGVLQMSPVETWDDLYMFFDAHDIRQYGAMNLWNVLERLRRETQDLFQGSHNVLGLEVTHFLFCWLIVEANRNVIRKNVDGKSLSDIFRASDLQALIQNCFSDPARQVLQTLADAVSFCRHLLQHRIVFSPRTLLRSIKDGQLSEWICKCPSHAVSQKHVLDLTFLASHSTCSRSRAGREQRPPR